MVSGRSTASAWQAVASKVVVANRKKRGLGRGVKIEDFKVDGLGGRSGPLVFGPMSVFNGTVSMRVKKPMTRAKLTVAFHGVTEVDKSFVPFFINSSDVYVGDLQEGLRTFLFAFSFPHINLPPTSSQPLISYSFSATMSVEGTKNHSADGLDLNRAELLEYRSKPLRIEFIPYVDPALETPLVSRKPSMRKKKSQEKNASKRSISPSTQTVDLQGLSPDATPTSPKMRGPKLTLTTADLPSSASSNSTPVIDKPHPSLLSSAISRTTRITDDENNTIAKLTVDMPASRFLPGEDIAMKLTLHVREGIQPPKGLGARVVESRCLASDNPAEKSELENPRRNDEEYEPPKMKIFGKEYFRVLTGKKFILHQDNGVSFEEFVGKDLRCGVNKTQQAAAEKHDTGLVGGKELIEVMTVTLPPFQTFIKDSLLPTSTLPLGDPKLSDDLPMESSSPMSPSPKIMLNGKSKDTDDLVVEIMKMYFKVSHFVQITIPMNGPSSWFKLGNATVLQDLDVIVPIIIGNKNPQNILKHSIPELKINAPSAEAGKRIIFGNGEGTSGSIMSRSSRSDSRSSASVGRETITCGWKNGEKFLTLRETARRPEFVVDA